MPIASNGLASLSANIGLIKISTESHISASLTNIVKALIWPHFIIICLVWVNGVHINR